MSEQISIQEKFVNGELVRILPNLKNYLHSSLKEYFTVSFIQEK